MPAPSLPTATTDLCDLLGERAQVPALPWRHFGGVRQFAGPAATIQTSDDNGEVRKALEQPGAGRVLVVDNGGRTGCAMVGGNLGMLGESNGWAGIVVWGAVRDTAELANQQLGVVALGAVPRASRKRGLGSQGVALRIADSPVSPADWVAVDGDGVVFVAAVDLAQAETAR